MTVPASGGCTTPGPNLPVHSGGRPGCNLETPKTRKGDGMSQGGSPPHPPTVKYFDSVADEYFSRYWSNTPGGVAFQLRHRAVLALFDKPSGKVLDIGCGPGVIVADLLARGCTVYGVDPSTSMVRRCQERFGSRPDAHFSVGAVEQLGFPDRTFDAVVCIGVIERASDNQTALREMARVLKPGGSLLVSVPNRYSPYLMWRNWVFYPVVSLLRPLYYRLSRRQNTPVIPGHVTYSARSYSAAMSENSCPVTAHRYCGFNFLVPPLDRAFPRLTVRAMRRAEALRRGPLRGLGYTFLLRGRKK